MKCPKCGKIVLIYHADRRYYVYDEDEDKVIEICKECLNKRKEHRMFVKVRGKTRIID